MRYGYFLLLMTLALPTQAEIYKCVVNGQVEYSGQPCADDAEVVELKIKQPSKDAIAEQQARTESFQQEGKFSDINSLNKKNDELEAQISALKEESQAVLAEMGSKTYRVDDDTIGTREHGLFKRMRDVRADYDRKVNDLKQQIYQNELEIDRLYQQ